MKRPVRQEIKEFGSIILVLILIIVIFSYLRGLRESKPSNKISQEDNAQLNNIEQYHLSQGHNIKFVEDIF